MGQKKEATSIDNVPRMINEQSRNHLFLLYYLSQKPSMTSHALHSHSMVPGGLLVTS